MSLRYYYIFVVFTVACGEEGKPAGLSCPSLDGLDSGTMDGELDGAVWSTSGTNWAWTGDSLQIGTPATGGWLLSIVLQQSEGGDPARDAVEGALPVAFTLATGTEGGWAVLYPDSGDSFSTKEADGGTLVVTAYDPAGSLEGCLDLVASDGTTDVSLSDGRFRADPR